jgi:putative hemolysin
VGSRTAGAANVRLFDTKGALVREFKNVLPGRFPNGVNVAVGDVDADNYDDIIVSAGAGREGIITAISGRDIADGVANPEKIFTFVAGGGAKAGVKVAVGYVAPSTVPSYKPNLVTTPEVGLNAGTISVWNMDDIVGDSHSMPMGGGMSMGGTSMGGTSMGGMSMPSDMPSTDGPPKPVTTFRPFGAKRGAVNLATTYQSQLGGQAKPVVAAWQTPLEAAFTSIGLDNKPQTIKRRF